MNEKKKQTIFLASKHENATNRREKIGTKHVETLLQASVLENGAKRLEIITK